MSAPQKTLATLLSLLLVATLWGLWSTGQEPAKVQGAKAAAADTPANPVPVIDENTLFTAHRLARLATTPEEQPYAQAAVQLADHELDLAFSGALRRLEAHPPVLNPEALQFQQAEQEWQIASRGRRGSTLSASPGIAVRPAVGGVEIAVRYVTRASERFALRAKLYQSAVQLLADAPKS